MYSQVQCKITKTIIELNIYKNKSQVLIVSSFLTYESHAFWYFFFEEQTQKTQKPLFLVCCYLNKNKLINIPLLK